MDPIVSLDVAFVNANQMQFFGVARCLVFGGTRHP
jgi:hypothetical protein